MTTKTMCRNVYEILSHLTLHLMFTSLHMKFTIEHNAHVLGGFIMPSHLQALTYFEALAIDGYVLRDYQRYRVDRDSLAWVTAWASIDWLRRRMRPVH